MTPTEIEAGDERRVLEALFYARHSLWPGHIDGPHSAWLISQRFCALLDAGAYLDAAMMLVPEGWTYGAWQGPSGQPHTWELRTIGAEDQRYRTVEGKAPTPALALCAAIARAGGE